MEEGAVVRKVSVKRIAMFFLWLVVAIVGLIVGLVMLAAVADIVHWHGIRRGFIDDPSMNVYPTPLSDTSLAAAQGITTMTASGCSIDLPWPNVRVLRGRFAELPDARGLSFEDPATTTDEAGIFRETFSGSEFQSNYDFLAAQLNFNPDELPVLPWGHRHQRQIVFAVDKSTMMPTDNHEPIYSVTLGNVRGFQLGKVNRADGFLELRMFDPKDRQFRIRIFPGASHMPWTQPEINFIIHSMRCDDATYSAARQAWDSKLHGHR